MRSWTARQRPFWVPPTISIPQQLSPAGQMTMFVQNMPVPSSQHMLGPSRTIASSTYLDLGAYGKCSLQAALVWKGRGIERASMAAATPPTTPAWELVLRQRSIWSVDRHLESFSQLTDGGQVWTC